MIPLRDNVPTRHFPIVTVGLIVANVLFYFLYQRGGLAAAEGPIRELAFQPCEVNDSCAVEGQDWPLTSFTSMVAHYATLLLVAGQLAIPLASDPLGYGWDLFGTLDYRINVQPLSADAVYYLQGGALLAGHMIGLALAHDKALAVFGTTRVALRTQFPLLALMIVYTAGGLWLLSRG